MFGQPRSGQAAGLDPCRSLPAELLYPKHADMHTGLEVEGPITFDFAAFFAINFNNTDQAH